MIAIQTATSGPDRIGPVITSALFGVNFLFDRDRLDPAGTYAKAIADLGATSIRYPGGTLTERFFDLLHPNASLQTAPAGPNASLFDPDGAGPLTASTAGLWDTITAAGAAGLSMTFVMPTIRFAGTTRDAAGNRYEAVDAALVHDFTLDLLSHALAAGVTLSAIELGNEWWADASATFGETLSAVEYGRIASRLAMVMQTAIDEFRASHTLPATWVEPELQVQVGPGGKAEQVLPTGEPVPAGYTGPTVSATGLIFEQFNLAAEQQAIDGLVTHRYLTGNATTGWAYVPFDSWDALAAGNANFHDLSRNVSEWNVAARNDAAHGLLQVPWLVSMVGEAVRAGVTHADIWAVQQNNATNLSTTSGAAGEIYAGLSIAGEAFRLMKAELPGLQALDMVPLDGALSLEAFGSASRSVLFLSNMTGALTTGTFDVSDVARGYTHAWATTLGTTSANPLDGEAVAEVSFLTQAQLMSGTTLSVSLDAYETICIAFTLDGSGVTIAGRGLSDKLAGSAAGDTLSGGAGNDQIDGLGGNDLVTGGAGQDRMTGGAGLDTLDGGDAKDVLWGGDGNDQLLGGAGNDILAGDAGADTLRGGAGVDSLTGGTGADVFLFAATSDSGKGAADTITDFLPGTDRIDLSLIDASTRLAGDQAFRFIGTQAFSRSAGELHVTATTGGRIVEGDVNGDGTADFQIILTGAVTLGAADFLL